MDIKKICLLVLLTVALPASAWMPQQSTVEDGAAKERLKQWVKNMVMFNYMFPQEKVYVHLDNTGYFQGETIWLKAYVLRADQNRWTNMSQVLYVDLVTPSGEVFTTRKLPIRNGMAEGSIALEGFMNSGFYEVRAYTRYMANFDNHTAFSRVIPVFKKPEKEGDYSQATIDQTDYRSLQPQLREEAERLKNRGGLGVRFFPEGGRALVGQPCRVAVEVVDKSGRAVSTRCRLMQQQKETAVVTTDVHGRGYVSYTPGAQDDAYLLVDGKEGDKEQRFPLPAPSLSGVTLSVDVMGEQEVGVDVLATADQRAEPLGLVLMSRGNVKSFDAVTADGGRYHKTYQRKDLTDGVNRVLLISQQGQLLADRMFFVYPRQGIDTIAFTAEGQQLRPGQKTTIEAVTRPKCVFSIAIRDYDTDANGPLQRADTWLLLSSELRGYIADADYFLESDDAEHRRAADLLMMVQGWHRYNVPQMLTAQRPEAGEPLEDGLYVMGRLLPINKRKKNAVDSVDVTVRLYNALGQVLKGEDKTDSTGHFAFKIPDADGMWRMNIKTTRDGKPHNYYVSLDRHPALQARLIDSQEQQRVPFGTSSVDVPVAPDFDKLLPMEVRNVLLNEVLVNGRNRLSSWRDENIGARTAGIYYDCAREAERLADQGKEPPSLFQWLQERNEYFKGDNDISSLDWFKDDASRRYTLYAVDDVDMSYKGHPIVWILNNDFYGITHAPKGTAYNMLTHPSIIDFPVLLDDLKSIYISEDENMLKKYIMDEPMSPLTSRHPVMVFLYTDGVTSKEEKGVRKTSFETFSLDQYDMPGYAEVPPVVDFRRTLYWNPTVVTDENGRAKIEFYNGATTRKLSISAEGIEPNGRVVVYKQ